MADILAEIHSDHRNYSQLLELIRAELVKLSNSTNPNYIRLYDIMLYMTNYPDLIHHPVEEILFTELVKKKPELSETLSSLSLEHKKLASVGRELKENLQIVVSGAIVSRKTLIDSAIDYHQLLTSHMNTEEGEILPVLGEAFNENEWSVIEAQVTVLHDSMFENVIQEQFSDLYKRITHSRENAD